MKLTEVKLKQMILEALKNRNYQDFGIPTPDEKLRSKLGDAKFDKIQGLDSEQSEIFKQSFDPNYPRSIKQETINDVLEPLGFKDVEPEFIDPFIMEKLFILGEFRPNVPTFKAEFEFGYSKYYERNPKNPDGISYLLKIKKITLTGTQLESELLLEKKAHLDMSSSFYVDMTDENQREEIESLIVKKEKADILKALWELI